VNDLTELLLKVALNTTTLCSLSRVDAFKGNWKRYYYTMIGYNLQPHKMAVPIEAIKNLAYSVWIKKICFLWHSIIITFSSLCFAL